MSQPSMDCEEQKIELRSRVEVKWTIAEDETAWYKGVVKRFVPGEGYHIKYDDGDTAMAALEVETEGEEWRLISGPQSKQARFEGPQELKNLRDLLPAGRKYEAVSAVKDVTDDAVEPATQHCAPADYKSPAKQPRDGLPKTPEMTAEQLRAVLEAEREKRRAAEQKVRELAQQTTENDKTGNTCTICLEAPSNQVLLSLLALAEGLVLCQGSLPLWTLLLLCSVCGRG